MRPYNGIIQDGKLTVRKNEDRGKREHPMHKDRTLEQADVCLHCQKPDCKGEELCYERQAKKRE